MGHEVIIYGMIDGASLGGDRRRDLQGRNAEAIAVLPTEDEWPWLTRPMFALPGPWPQGTYRSQVIHFGLSLKDEPPLNLKSACDPETGWPEEDRPAIYEWLKKFERLLMQLYWYGADVHFSTDFEPDMHFTYLPTQDAIEGMFASDPRPIDTWERRWVQVRS